MCGKIIYMNKMIARTALVATLAISAMSLTACGSDNDDDCANAASSTTVTATAAMFPSKGGSHGHASSHGTSSGSRGFRWFWMGNGSHSEQCDNPAPTSNS